VLPATTASPSPPKPATRAGVASTQAAPAARSRRAVASALLSAAHQANTWSEQDAALDALHAAIALDPENGAARVALAIHLARGGNREGAKRNLAYLASLKTDGARAALRDARSNPVVRDLVPVAGR
jgi:Flp pilus assembly protein TadD